MAGCSKCVQVGSRNSLFYGWCLNFFTMFPAQMRSRTSKHLLLRRSNPPVVLLSPSSRLLAANPKYQIAVYVRIILFCTPCALSLQTLNTLVHRSLQCHHPTSPLHRPLLPHLPLQMHPTAPRSAPPSILLSPLPHLCGPRGRRGSGGGTWGVGRE